MSEDRAQKVDPVIKSIIENYDLLSLLGEGGMGKVFKVRNKMVDRIESLKILKIDASEDIDNMVARFRREIRIVASIKRDFPDILIPEIFSSQAHEGCLYYTMEFVEGKDLKEVMLSTEPNRAIEIIIGIAKILEKVHSKNVLHRDIKPANIVIDNNDRVWLLDFGITKQIQGQFTCLTEVGYFVGTPQYLSPEQVLGEALGPSSDIYSVGVILYEILTRKSMTMGKNIDEILESVLDNPIPPIEINKEIPEELNTICLKAVNKNEKLRYQNATELCEDLEKYMVSRETKPFWKKLFCKS